MKDEFDSKKWRPVATGEVDQRLCLLEVGTLRHMSSDMLVLRHNQLLMERNDAEARAVAAEQRCGELAGLLREAQEQLLRPMAYFTGQAPHFARLPIDDEIDAALSHSAPEGETK